MLTLSFAPPISLSLEPALTTLKLDDFTLLNYKKSLFQAIWFRINKCIATFLSNSLNEHFSLGIFPSIFQSLSSNDSDIFFRPNQSHEMRRKGINRNGSELQNRDERKRKCRVANSLFQTHLSLESVATKPNFWTTFIPSFTLPKMVCFRSKKGVGARVRKNWLPFVFGPAFAIAKIPAPVNRNSVEISSANWERKAEEKIKRDMRVIRLFDGNELERNFGRLVLPFRHRLKNLLFLYLLDLLLVSWNQGFWSIAEGERERKEIEERMDAWIELNVSRLDKVHSLSSMDP